MCSYMFLKHVYLCLYLDSVMCVIHLLFCCVCLYVCMCLVIRYRQLFMCNVCVGFPCKVVCVCKLYINIYIIVMSNVLIFDVVSACVYICLCVCLCVCCLYLCLHVRVIVCVCVFCQCVCYVFVLFLFGVFVFYLCVCMCEFVCLCFWITLYSVVFMCACFLLYCVF